MQKQYHSLAGAFILPDIAYAAQVVCSSIRIPDSNIGTQRCIYQATWKRQSISGSISYRSATGDHTVIVTQILVEINESCRTTDGYMFLLASALFGRKSKLLLMIPLSSAESETYCVDSAQLNPLSEMLAWIVKVLEEISCSLLGDEPCNKTAFSSKV